MTRATNPHALRHLLQAGMDSVPQNKICRTCQVNCWLCAPSMGHFIPLPEKQGQTGRRDVAKVEFAPLKSEKHGENNFFNLCHQVGGTVKPCHPPAPPQLPVPGWLLRRQRVPRLASPVPQQRRRAPPPPWAAGKSLCPGNPKQSWVCPAATALPQAGGGVLAGLNRGSHREPVPRLLRLGEEAKDAPGTCRVPLLLPCMGSPSPWHRTPSQAGRPCLSQGGGGGKGGVRGSPPLSSTATEDTIRRMRQVETGYASLWVHPPQMWWHFVAWLSFELQTSLTTDLLR